MNDDGARFRVRFDRLGAQKDPPELDVDVDAAAPGDGLRDVIVAHASAALRIREVTARVTLHDEWGTATVRQGARTLGIASIDAPRRLELHRPGDRILAWSGFVDDLGRPLAAGDRVDVVSVDDDGIPAAARRGTVVGFGRTRIHVRWDTFGYPDDEQHHEARTDTDDLGQRRAVAVRRPTAAELETAVPPAPKRELPPPPGEGLALF